MATTSKKKALKPLVPSPPTLKCEVVSHFKVDSYDLENFINKIYFAVNKEISFYLVSDMEWSNDSTHTFSVQKEPWDAYLQGKMDKFLIGRGSYSLRVILTDLANRDLIPEGNYLITVCW